MPWRKAKVEAALKQLVEAALEYANVLDETGYEAKHAPEYMEDADDFAYDIQSFVQDEMENISSNVVVEVDFNKNSNVIELKVEAETQAGKIELVVEKQPTA